MPRTYSSIEKIRAEHTWVTETPDPNKCGCRNLRCCEETGHKPEHVMALSQQSSGRFAGSTTVRPAVSMAGAWEDLMTDGAFHTALLFSPLPRISSRNNTGCPTSPKVRQRSHVETTPSRARITGRPRLRRSTLALPTSPRTNLGE